MARSRLLQLIAAYTCALQLVSPHAATAAAARELGVKPHVIFALIDDWGSYDAAWREKELGRTPQLKTPTLDELAAQGVKLDNYYVQHICTPTRQALMSARYQIHTGLQHGIIQNSQRSCLPPKFSTMADAFKAGGYATHMIGKWHLGLYKDACLPWKRGFSTFYGYLTGSELHFTKMQRSARGVPGNASQKTLYPDFRSEAGPIETKCVQVPPHTAAPAAATPLSYCEGDSPAPPPRLTVSAGATPWAQCPPAATVAAPAASLGALPPANWTYYGGALAAGNDLGPPLNMTRKQAEAHCVESTACLGFTFSDDSGPSASSCGTSPCQMYFKTRVSINSDPLWGIFLKQPLPVPPNPHRADPECYSAHMFASEAVAVVRAHAQHHDSAQQQQPSVAQPMFMYLAMQDVHEPVNAPFSYIRKQDPTILDSTRRTYAAMVSAVDEGIANLTASLRAASMWQNTLLVISNDNGGWNGYGGINYPLRGHKTTMWEGGIKGIGWLVAPGLLQPGSRYRNLLHVTDWLPTLASAAGVDLASLGSGFAGIDGVSHWEALTAPASSASRVAAPRHEILVNIDGVNGTGEAALRVGDYKLLRSNGPLAHASMGMDLWCDVCADPKGCESGTRPVPLGGTVCTNTTTNATAAGLRPEYAATACTDDQGNAHGCWLFNLAQDPSESNNVARAEPGVFASMLQKLSAYNAGNVGCCSCQLKPDLDEMALAPKDGVWFTFHDQRDPAAEEAPLCDLLREPPAVMRSTNAQA